LRIITITTPGFAENVYIYYDENSLAGVVIDPGDEAAAITKIINENKINVEAILLTHGHIDHIAAVNEIRELTGACVCAYAEDEALLIDPKLNMSAVFFGKNISVKPDVLLTDGERANGIGGRLKTIWTPGHTRGSACFYDAEEGILFSGDTLFLDSIGRTDLPGGDYETLIDSIKSKLLTLPDETRVYPGHYGATTIEREKRQNPFIN